MNGLYGKKPVAKTRIAIGIRRFAKASKGQETFGDITGKTGVCPTHHQFRRNVFWPGSSFSGFDIEGTYILIRGKQ